MKLPIGVTFDAKMLRELDRHELAENMSRSAIIRVAVSEFLRKEKVEKENKYETQSEEK